MTIQRSKPLGGRDRMGILGAPFGATSVPLTNGHAQNIIGLNDVYAEVIFNLPEDPISSFSWIRVAAAPSFRLGINTTDGRPIVWITSQFFCPDSISDHKKRRLHLFYFLHRSGSAYVYEPATGYSSSIDISAEVATDITSNTLWIAGDATGPGRTAALCQLARLFVIDPADFPNADERAAIVSDRHFNPDVESPILAARTNYDAERRLHVPLDNVPQDGTTVPNLGTGGDPTIGGGKKWYEVRTVAEKATIIKPDEDWYSLDNAHKASVAADIGCIQGSYIKETVYKDARYPLGNRYIAGLWKGIEEQFSVRYVSSTLQGFLVHIRTNNINYDFVIEGMTGYSKYGRDGLNVLHQVYDAVANKAYVFVNRQKIKTLSIADDLDLSGSTNICTGTAGSSINGKGWLAHRLWNWPSLPDGWEEEIHRRVANPWRIFEGHPWGHDPATGLKGNWEGRAGAQLTDSLVVKNLAQPTVGDLIIQPATSWGASRVRLLKAA